VKICPQIIEAEVKHGQSTNRSKIDFGPRRSGGLGNFRLDGSGVVLLWPD
jgi:hypothetical protein